MALAQLRQGDFSAGMFRSLAPHMIPPNGAFDLLNYLIDNEGSAYERGGIRALSDAFADSDFTFVHDGLYEVGRRTFFATKNKKGVLDADGHTPIVMDNSLGLPNPVRGTMIGGRLYMDGGYVYAGARKAGVFTAGTASLALGSDTVVGSGTSFDTDAAPGMIFGFGPRNYVVKSVTNATHLVLTQKAKETTSAHGYTVAGTGQPRMVSDIYGTAGKRLLALIGDKLYFSRNIDNPTEVLSMAGTGGGGGAAFAGLLAKPDEDPENFVDGDYHQIPGSPAGLGLASWGDTAIVFTTDGVWLVSNMDLDPVDDAGNIQQSLIHSAPQIVLWHRNGVAGFEDAFIVPARDGIYVMGAGSLERIDTPITPLYRSYVRSGYTLGLATVSEGHYLLPILSGTDYVDTLVVRLDRPVRTSTGTVHPWTHFDGLPIRAFAKQETASSPNLLIASTGNRLLQGHYFEPDAVASDDNGTAFTSQLVSRDLPTGNGNTNVVRRLDVDYDLVDTSDNDNPTLLAAYATGHPAESASYTTLADTGAEGTDQYKRWFLNSSSGPPRARHIRIRLRSSGRLQKLVIRSLALWTRQSGKND